MDRDDPLRAELREMPSQKAWRELPDEAKAQVDTLQMIVPVKGRYPDVRRWIEEILATQPYTALNELGFKREEIGINQIEARVRLTLWLRPAGAADGGGSIDP